jgi:hypothetical protein
VERIDPPPPNRSGVGSGLYATNLTKKFSSQDFWKKFYQVKSSQKMLTNFVSSQDEKMPVNPNPSLEAQKTDFNFFLTQKFHHHRVQHPRKPLNDIHNAIYRKFTILISFNQTRKSFQISVIHDGENSSSTFKGLPRNLENCHYHGNVISHNNVQAAISNCRKLMGVIVMDDHFLMLQTIPERVRDLQVFF